MDIEGFYDADPRRRHSEEINFGRDWTDTEGTRWKVPRNCLPSISTIGRFSLLLEATHPFTYRS